MFFDEVYSIGTEKISYMKGMIINTVYVFYFGIILISQSRMPDSRIQKFRFFFFFFK